MKTKIYIPSDSAHEALINAPNLTWEQIDDHYPPSVGVRDWRGLHKEKHWRKFYSAYELAVSWESADPFLPQEIQELFGDSAELLAVIPEHKTPLPGGSRPSQTDALTFIQREGEVYAVAVEGKALESFGPTVGEWRKDASDGKIERLESIRNTLGLPKPIPDEIRYQLLHRTASAVIEAERFHVDCAAMVVHSFAYKQARDDSELFDDFSAFLKLFRICNVEKNALYPADKSGKPLYFAWASLKR